MTQYVPPVVSVLGHVDHGKTTLLDAIRKTNIAAREHGGITQKIGFSTVSVLHESQKRDITFIDTPGHEAFTSMRSRGSQVADIGILVVSSVDGVMPQTRESIELLLKAKIPFVVALTKIDSVEKNPEKVKQQLLREKIMLEGYGGDVPILEISAKTGKNIKELLDLILLVWSMSTKTKPDNMLKAIVIESKLDPKSGPKATLVMKSGVLAIKDEIISEKTEGKVKSLITDNGSFVQKVSTGYGAEVLGFTKVPSVGSLVSNKAQTSVNSSEDQQNQHKPAQAGQMLSLLICADTYGSLEAISYSLPKEVHLATQKTGEVSEADILYAKQVGALILTFNIKFRSDIVKFAQTEKVVLKNYTIIYEMLNEIKQVIDGKAQALLEQVYGVAKIMASFPFEKSTVLGIAVLEGRIARGDKIRLMRGEEIVGESNIVSLRHGKDIVSKVEKGKEGGILMSPLLDFSIGGMILSHS